MNWDELFGKFNQLRILVLGDVMIDSYLFGKVDRISPEAPVPVVAVEKRDVRLGGAANVALNLKALGCKVSVASVIGKDESGEKMLELFREADIDSGLLKFSTSRKTTVKHRIIGNRHQMLRVDDESLNDILPVEELELYKAIEARIGDFDAVIFEDYDKGVLTTSLISKVVDLAKKQEIPSIVDPKKNHFLDYKSVDLFKPNLKEIKEGLKIDTDLKDINALKSAVKELASILEANKIMVTLSEAGVMIAENEQFVHLPAHLRDIADVSGAGDTVVSVAAVCLALECSSETIAFLSNLAGGLVCEEVGVVPVNKSVLLEEAKRLRP